MGLLKLTSTPEQFQARVEELRQFGYSKPKALAELEMIHGEMIKQLKIEDLEGQAGRVEIFDVTEILEELEVDETCWQGATEQMIFVLWRDHKQEVVRDLIKARKWEPEIIDLLNAIYQGEGRK